MPRKLVKPISDEELAGLIMAVTAEAGRADWNVRMGIQDDGSLVLHMGHKSKRFHWAQVNSNGRFERLAISPKASAANVTAAQPDPSAYHYKTEPVTAEVEKKEWTDE